MYNNVWYCVDIIHERRVMYKLPSLCHHLNLHTYGLVVDKVDSISDDALFE
jgi:hypothetical protein